MNNWFTCKVKYQKEDEYGSVKNVTETYLTDALSFTEAEARIYEEMGQRVMGDFQVSSIAKSKVTDGFEYPDTDLFYQAKVSYMVADADSGKEKKVTQLMLTNAQDVRQAWERIHESLNNMLVTFTVPEVKESSVLEIFHHHNSGEKAAPEHLTPVSEENKDEQDI